MGTEISHHSHVALLKQSTQFQPKNQESHNSPSLVPRPHPLTRRNSLVNQVEFLGLAHAFVTLSPSNVHLQLQSGITQFSQWRCKYLRQFSSHQICYEFGPEILCSTALHQIIPARNFSKNLGRDSIAHFQTIPARNFSRNLCRNFFVCSIDKLVHINSARNLEKKI